MTKRPRPGTYAIDLFAGCGGLSLGLELSGFETLLFSELNKDAAATYQANRPDPSLKAYGDVYKLTNATLRSLREEWRKEGIEDIDIVAGGPPCQGYSKIGHRRTFKLKKDEIPSNQLYKEMVRIVASVSPKLFLFENVSGLLTSRWNPEGKKGDIFRDVLRAFLDLNNYTVRWQLVHAKDYGVPQNRPRILIVGIRRDLGFAIPPAQEDPETVLKPTAVADGLLPVPTGKYPDLADLLGDLIDSRFTAGGSTTRYPAAASTSVQRILRTRLDGTVARKGDVLTEHDYSHHSPKIREKFVYMIKHGGVIPEAMQTKKFAQRVLLPKWSNGGPNITATSLPDDFVHFSQPRILSVREWARLQMFPDWYQFRGPRTTGGRRRAGDPGAGIWDRDVPKYTQIGNAVPVGLSRAVGEHLSKLLRQARRQ
jgi:DNA (cytosine-5)-methyltransferase 1